MNVGALSLDKGLEENVEEMPRGTVSIRRWDGTQRKQHTEPKSQSPLCRSTPKAPVGEGPVLRHHPTPARLAAPPASLGSGLSVTEGHVPQRGLTSHFLPGEQPSTVNMGAVQRGALAVSLLTTAGLAH